MACITASVHDSVLGQIVNLPYTCPAKLPIKEKSYLTI